MGVDTSALTMEEQMEIMQQNIPQMQSGIQDLADTIVGEGGILNATADAMKEINEATSEYDKNVKDMLASAGTSLQTIEQAIDKEGNALDKNIQNAEAFITINQKLIDECNAQIEAMEKMLDYMDKYLNKVINV
jgi:mevalonate kinase